MGFLKGCKPGQAGRFWQEEGKKAVKSCPSRLELKFEIRNPKNSSA